MQCVRQGLECPQYKKPVIFFELREVSDDTQIRLSRRGQLVHPRPRNEHVQPCLYDNTSYLISYYFEYICPLLSCFDSPTNPFRVEVSDAMQDSESISYCIQAMSASHISKTQITRKQEGISLHNQAMGIVRSRLSEVQTKIDEKLVLSVILIGISDVGC